jgi:hypothetical protein
MRSSGEGGDLQGVCVIDLLGESQEVSESTDLQGRIPRFLLGAIRGGGRNHILQEIAGLQVISASPGNQPSSVCRARYARICGCSYVEWPPQTAAPACLSECRRCSGIPPFQNRSTAARPGGPGGVWGSAGLRALTSPRPAFARGTPVPAGGRVPDKRRSGAERS